MKSNYTYPFLILIGFLILCFFVNISLGSVSIPTKQIFKSLIGNIDNESWQYIIQNYRLPKAFTAILVGSGLGISGLLMQTLFRNPLAGPFVLGISSGASLGVALVILKSIFKKYSNWKTLTSRLVKSMLLPIPASELEKVMKL